MKDIIEDSEMEAVTAALENEIDYESDEVEDDIDLLTSLEYGTEVGRVYAGKIVRDLFKDFASSGSSLDSEFAQERFQRSVLFRNTSDVDASHSRMARLSEYVSFKPNKKSGKIDVWIPVLDKFELLSVSTFASSSPFIPIDRPYEPEKIVAQQEALLARVEKIFGKDVWDVDKGVNYSEKLTSDSWTKTGVPSSAIDDDDEFMEWFTRRITAIRISSAAAKPEQKMRKMRNLSNAEENGMTPARAKMDLLRARNFMVFIKIELQMETAKYNVQVDEDTKLPLGDFHMFLRSAIRDVCLTGEINETYKSISKIKKVTKDMRDIKRTNDFSLAVEKSGIPVYIPTVDNTESLDKAYTSKLVEDDFGFAIMPMNLGWSETENHPMADFRNKLAYTDTRKSKLSFYSDRGELKVRDLDRAIPFEDNHASRFMKLSIEDEGLAVSLKSFAYYSNKDEFIALLDKVEVDEAWFKGMVNSGTGTSLWAAFLGATTPNDLKGDELKNTLKQAMTRAESVAYFLDSFVNFMVRANIAIDNQMRLDDNFDMPESSKWVTLDPYTITLRDLTTASRFPPLRFIGAYMLEISKVLLKSPEKFIEQRSVDKAMEALGFATVVAKYMTNLKTLDKKYEEFQAGIAPVKATNDWTPKPMPGVNPSFSYLPHQGGIQQRIAGNPKTVMLAVDAGGGKTLSALGKIIQMMDDGLVKRPVIICPNNLISNYVQDMSTLNNQKYNLIPITRSSVMSHGEENITNLVKQAPPNTIYISDYHFVKGNKSEITYGNITIDEYANLEMMISFEFDAGFIDESHFAKNETSDITKATAKLMSTIPIRYVMSGTIVDGNLTDLVAQVNLLDPTVFGDMNAFLKKYASEYQGTKVLAWKQGAEEEIRQILDESISYVQVKKREWASLLPDGIEEFYPVELSSKQMKVYNAILKEVLDEIQQDAELLKMLKGGDDDEDAAGSAEMALRPYLARLEQFLTAPSTDALGKNLTDREAISPKATKAAELFTEHVKKKREGKVLIFTSYNRSADAIYDAIPDELKDKIILYKAANKAEFKARFMNDPNIIGMVGVETSLNTGHNFQNVSHLIRMEAVWNPGTLEQAESRIFRPDVANKYNIKAKVISWITASKTIDVTKTARLIFKLISKVKFEERYNENYEKLPRVPYVSMGFDSIAANNDFESELMEHIEAYSMYRQIVTEEYKEYRNRDDILKVNFKPKAKEMGKGSAIISDAPYIENHSLPYMERLGLTDTSTYASNMNGRLSEFDFTGLQVHTEFGDGVVVRSNKNSVSVKLKYNGERVNGIDKTKMFVFTDQDKARKDKVETKTKLASLSEMSLTNTMTGRVALPDPDKIKVDKKDKKDKEEKRPIPNTDLELNGSINLYALAMNGQIAVGIDDEDPDVNEDVLKSLGFQFKGPYHYAPITNRRQMRNFKDFILENEEKGNIGVPSKMMEEMLRVADVFDKNKNMAKVVNKLTAKELRIYYMMRKKKPKNPKTVHFYFTVEDGEMYVIMDSSVAIRGKQLVKKKIPGVKWKAEEGDFIKIVPNKDEAKSLMEDIEEFAEIGNKKDFKRELKSIKVRKMKENK